MRVHRTTWTGGLRGAVAGGLLGACLAALAAHPIRAGDSAPPAPPTMEQVRAALERSPGVPGRSASPWPAWGDAAVVHLTTVAGAVDAPALSVQVADALSRVGTVAAADLYVMILEGRTRCHPHAALTLLVAASPGWVARLRAQRGFEAALRQLAVGPWRSWVFSLWGEWRWTSAEPRLRDALTDPALHVREAAAEALGKITGRMPTIERPALTFPASSIAPEILSPPHVLPNRPSHRLDVLAFVQDAAGRPGLVFGERGNLWRVSGSVDAAPTRYEVATGIDSLVAAHDPSGSILGFGTRAAGPGDDRAREVVALAPDGSVRWSWPAPKAGDVGLVPLYDAAGLRGVGVALLYAGVVGLGLDGRARWSSESSADGVLDTHPALPGVVLVGRGELGLGTVVGSAGGARLVLAEAWPGRPGEDGTYRAALFPDKDGRPSVIAEAHPFEGEPSLRRLDAEGGRLWRATLPAQVGKLVRVESPGRRRLFAATLENALLVVFDAEGTLRWSGDFPWKDPDGRTATYRLAAGAIAPGRPVIALTTLTQTWLYEVHPDAAAAPR